MRDAINRLNIRVAGIFLVKPAQGGQEPVGLLESFNHALCYSKSGCKRKPDSQDIRGAT